MRGIVVCALAKNEELYINDWVKHYIDLGFDRIYLYDNNETDKPKLENVIDPFYLNFVTIYDIRGVKENRLQHRIYTEFYNTHKDKFNWCLFCDIDEYLFGVNNIKSFFDLPIHKNSKQIRVKWLLFGDDDLIERDMSKPVYKAFTKIVRHTLNRNLVDIGNLQHQGKSFIRGSMENIIIQSPHFGSIGNRDIIIPSVLPSGKPCYSKVVITENYSQEWVYLYHYMTKSLKEFVDQKLNRTDAVFGDLSIKMNYYWRINKQTPEKIEYLKKRGIM